MHANMVGKYALSLLHFNIEFVAGDEATYHLNVKESFEPILDLLLGNPSWNLNIELQAHYIEFCAEYYPDVIGKLKSLVDRGQVELISTHYSDQIYVAYPRRDLEVSMRLTDEILKKHGLKRSKVFFTQENFFSPKTPSVMKAHGYDVALIDYAYYNYFHNEPFQNLEPFYKYRDAYILIGFPKDRTLETLTKNRVTWTWIWYGDGEPVLAGHPYEITSFKYNKGKEDRLKTILSGLESQGFKVETIGNFVRELIGSGYKPNNLKPILEGAWNMPSNDGVYLWMGRYRNYWELDSQIRSLTYRSRKYLLAAEKLIEYARQKGADVKDLEESLKVAWANQLKSECSDPTGWRPTPNEVGYSINKSHLAEFYAMMVIDEVKKRTGIEKGVVDTKTGQVSTVTLQKPMLMEIKEVPIRLEFVGCTPSVRKFKISEEEYIIEVAFTPEDRVAGFLTPLKSRDIIYSEALGEDEIVHMSLGEFDFKHVYLPLTNGLISVSENEFIIKNNEKMHIAAKIDKEQEKIGFLVEDAPRQLPFEWEFRIYIGEEKEALKKAVELNVWPKVEI
jgi:hypothetical protein